MPRAGLIGADSEIAHFYTPWVSLRIFGSKTRWMAFMKRHMQSFCFRVLVNRMLPQPVMVEALPICLSLDGGYA